MRNFTSERTWSFALPDAGQKPRGLPRLGSLLERIRQLDQGRFAPGAAKEGDPHRQAGNEARRYIDVGIPRNCGGVGTAPSDVVAIDQVREPRRTTRGSDNGVNLVLVHERINTFGACQLMIRG